MNRITPMDVARVMIEEITQLEDDQIRFPRTFLSHNRLRKLKRSLCNFVIREYEIRDDN